LSVTTACFTCFVGIVGVDAVIFAETLAADAGAVAPLLRWNPHNMAQGENTPIQIKSTFRRGSEPLQQNISKNHSKQEIDPHLLSVGTARFLPG
jgi:hypothetical protein